MAGEEPSLTTTNASSDDDDPPLLSSYAVEALEEFWKEQRQRQRQRVGDGGEVTLMPENWGLSQFWYNRDTAEILAAELRNLALKTSSSVACVACPTIYVELKKLDPNISAQLLEYDTRFKQYGNDFVYYDYNYPKEVPVAMKHSYQVVVADPPYLSKECLTKVAETIAYLIQPENAYLMLLTGEVQKEIAAELLGLHPCGFRPSHTSKLGNEFRLFTNYDPGSRLGSWERSSIADI